MQRMNVTHANFAGLDLLASAVLLIDESEQIRYLNPSGENLLAVSSRAVLGRRLVDICTEPIRPNKVFHPQIDQAQATVATDNVNVTTGS